MSTEYQYTPQTPPAPAPPALPPMDHRERFVDDPRKKSVMWAVLLSAMPGLGHAYVGYYREAFRSIAVVCLFVLMLSTGVLRKVEPAFVMFLVFFILFTIVDAGRRASLYNQALAGLRPMDLPEDMQMTTGQGSLVGGVLLVLLGLVFFTNTMFGWSLQWVSRWWPLAFVAGGAWLIYADRQARQAEQSRDDKPVAE